MEIIGIVGYGVVGNATARMLKSTAEILIQDPEKGYQANLKRCDYIFICINEKSTSMSSLEKVIKEITETNEKATIIIRTTVIPGTTDKFIEKYNRDIVFMPEFLREWNVKEDARSPDKIVIGTIKHELFLEIKNLLWNIEIDDNRILQTKPIEAEMAKLALNSLALIKVVFAEELYDLANVMGADYQSIYTIFELDQNVNKRHLLAKKDNYRGANGKCLPKDTNFLIEAGKDNNRMSLLETAEILNKLYLKVKE